MFAVKIPKTEHVKIIEMINNGVKQKDVAKIYDVDPSTISEIVKQNGCSRIKHYQRIPLSEYDNVLRLYASGKSKQYIAEIYQSSDYYVGLILKENNVVCRHLPLDFSEEEVKVMHDMYDNNIQAKVIAQTYQIDVTSVYNLFKKYDFEIRPQEISRREYNIDANYFDSIDTPNKAYILGLLYADGCNKLSKHQVDLSLQEEDKHILEEIKTEMQFDKPLSFKDYKSKNAKHKNQYHLCITNKHISETLYNLGVVDAKSLILEFPTFLEKSLYSHFIRGYFDGDGCLYLGGTKGNPEVSIVSTIMFVQKVKDILENVIGVEMRIKTQKQHKPVTKVGVITGVNKICAFLNWIYEDADLKLNRKYEKYKQFLERYCKNINDSCLN